MKLKPCQFCGCVPSGFSARYGKNGWFAFVQCEVCGAEGKKFGAGKYNDIPSTDGEFWSCDPVSNACEKAAKMWNMRRCCDAEQDH